MIDHVEKSILLMKRKFDEPISVTDLANEANLSKFHFCRLFRRLTGVTPGRFLSAVRIDEAKHLLLSTARPVTEISYMVGYNSLGTFTTRFTNSVGLSPSAFRKHEPLAFPPGETWVRRTGGSASVTGRIQRLPAATELTVVGLFPGPIAEGKPVCGTIILAERSWRIDRVPSGQWYVLAWSLPDYLRGDVRSVVARHGPVVINNGASKVTADVMLRPRQITDPPILVAIPVPNGQGSGKS